MTPLVESDHDASDEDPDVTVSSGEEEEAEKEEVEEDEAEDEEDEEDLSIPSGKDSFTCSECKAKATLLLSVHIILNVPFTLRELKRNRF